MKCSDIAGRQTVVRPIGLRRALDASLLGGVSLLALMVGCDPGWTRSLTSTGSIAPTVAAQQAAMAATQQAAAAAAQAQSSLARASAALAAAQRIQQSAAAAAQAVSSSIPNGLTVGGLMPLGGTASDPLAAIRPDVNSGNPTLWRGADLPTQTTSGANVTVNINQTQQKGLFYWNTFNVGANTTVNFNQSSSDWIAFNRVLDPSAVPSQIFGHINALGSVYIINLNGIIFGAGSQVNVHTLVASSLDIGQLGTSLAARDQFYLTTGIANLNSFSINDPVGGATTNLVAGDVKVERGASITANVTTDISALGSPGSVYLFGANVSNSGSITVPTGEVAMVAARTIDLIPGGYSVLPTAVLGTDSSGNVLKFRGTEFRISQFASAYNKDPNGQTSPLGYPTIPNYLPGTGAVTHDGLINASRGIVVMNGDKITIDNPRDAAGNNLTDPVTGNLVQGVISVDTSIDRNSMVLLRAATSATLNGVITSLPFDDGAAPLPSGASAGSTVQNFTPAYIEMTAQSNVTVGSSGLISAPSAQVALHAERITQTSNVTGANVPNLFNQGGNPDVSSNTPNSPQTVLLAPGATIDVAGLQNVALPASYNFIPFKPLAEFADMPLQRPPFVSVGPDGTGVVYGQTLFIDIRASGTRADGTSWVGTPLADASGAVNAVGRSIFQLMTVGGSVSLATDLTNNNGVANVQTAGSVINVAGGNVKFLPGMVNTTKLLGIDGRIYNMENADPNMIYVGIAGQFTANHAHWNVTETWSLGTQTFSPGYTEGHAAGAVTVTTVSPTLDGTIYFGSSAGVRQINSGVLPSQGSLTLVTPSSVVIGASPSTNFVSQSQVTTTLSADTLSGYGLSALSVTANDLVVSSGNTLNLAPGGSFSVTAGGAIDIAGTVTAAGGAINFVTDRTTISGANPRFFKAPTDQSGAAIAANVFIGGTLDVSGRFVNDTGRFGAAASGPAFINGGSISITTNKSSDGGNDTTGSILLAKGSVLDVSSGGYISPQGTPKRTSSGVMAGKAGSISLVLYQGAQWNATQNPPLTPTSPTSMVAVLELDGSLLAYGFESNGSLRLGSADTIRIGGSLQPGETSAISIGGVRSTLPVSLLTGGGFGTYTIESVADGWSPGYTTSANITVSAGTNLTLQQQNLSSQIDYSTTATGTRLGQQTAPALALLSDDRRQPVNLALKADTIVLDTGSKIVTDPKAKITFGGIKIDHTLAATDPTRDVAASSVKLLGSIVDHSGNVLVNAVATYLGPQALVDLSGTFVANSRFGLPGSTTTSGTLLAGGTFTIEAAALNVVLQGGLSSVTTYVTDVAPSGSYAVADAGARVDVSGFAGTIQALGSRGGTSSVWEWSDAGTVSADLAGFAWGGTFTAMGGRYVGTDGQSHADPRANGGTVILGGGSIALRQDTTDVISALANFHLGAPPPSSLFVAADQLAPFDNVYLYAATAQNGAGRIFTDLPGNTYGVGTPAYRALNITGAINWSVTNRLNIAAAVINAPASGDAQLSAPYVLFTGGGSAAAAGGSTLRVTGQTIDVEGAAFSGFRQVNLISSGDIRLSTPKVANGIGLTDTTQPTENSTFTGQLVTAGDLLLSAQRIYPVSAVTFTIQTPGNVKFAAPAGSNTDIPLSAGGGITVIANTIDQAGNLFAPLGKITLGNTDNTVSSITTQTVTLEPGSLTSVTLADTIVPYGATVDGTNWYYNANLNPLSQPPSKGLVLAGVSVKRADGSTIDLRGGGDLQATEWIQGKGGSRDTLTTTPSGQPVYALVPSQSSPIAAFDIQFATARSADGGKTATPGDTLALVGTQITLDGGNGIPAGTYTLYPAHYATLPGAMRVVVEGDNLGHNVPTGTTLNDGTVLVTGHTVQSTVPGKQTSGQTLFAVQTNAVWQQYSEYSFSRANTYFPLLAGKEGLIAPRLPMDAGRLAVIAQQTIVLDGIALTQPGQDSSGNIGRGGELDISAPQLAVVSHAQIASNDIPTGFVGLDITQLNGFESILIGGLRSDTTTGTLITPTSSNVVVDTRGAMFTAPEILLVATPVRTLQTVTTSQGAGINVTETVLAPDPNSGTVTIKAGSIVATTGIVHSGAGRNYYFNGPTANNIAAALGGTLDPTGTVITGADVSKLNYTAPGGATHTGTISAADRTTLQNYATQTGALFVATNDPTLNVSGPAGMPSSLTVKFAPGSAGAVNDVLLSADSGRVTIEPGVNVTTRALTLQATASTNSIVINTNDVHVQQLNVRAQTIGLGSPTLVTDKSVALYNLQFADVGALALKALSGTITVYGDYNPGQNVSSLTLDAAAVVRADSGGAATVSDRGTITLVNTGTLSGTTSAPASSGGFGLSFNAPDIVLGGGIQTVLGYGQVNLNAADRVFIAGPGALTLGATALGAVVDLNVSTPLILVGGATASGSGSFAVSTLGNIGVANSITQSGIADRPADSAEIGGSLSLTGASITVGSTIQAQAGTIKLEATTGDVALLPRAYLAAGGFTNTLVDVVTYVSGGKVVLNSIAGNVTTDPLSVIDVAQPAGGRGYGGEIDVTALGGNAALAGILRGAGGPGLGGRFKLDIKGAADLTALAGQLLNGGITGAIDIHTRTGNLTLLANTTLKANNITLTADDTTWVSTDVNQQFGQIYIGGLIDASGYSGTTLDGNGQAGGQVAIYGANSVTLASTGVINASTTHADERGGDVTVGIGWGANAKIFLQTGTQINVSGGTKGGLSGGTVTFSAPRDGNNDVKIAGLSNVRDSNGVFEELPTIDGANITITGARSLTVDGFVSFDTKASSHGLDGSQFGWNGTIDPAGWFKSDGSVATTGSWTNVSGWQVSFSTLSGFSSVPTQVVTIIGADGTPLGTLSNYVMGVNTFSATNPGDIPANKSGTVTFNAPTGGVAATGTWSTDANGTLTFVVSNGNRGSGFTSSSASATLNLSAGGTETVNGRSTLAIVSAQIQLSSSFAGYNGTSAPKAPTLVFSGGFANFSFTQASGFSGQTIATGGSTLTFVPATNNYIPSTSSGVYSPFNPATQGTTGTANFTGDGTTNRPFFANTLAQVTQGTWSYTTTDPTTNVTTTHNYGFSNLFNRLQPLVAQLGAGVVHVQPGIELVNSSGDINVKDNWNLAAGTAGNLQTAKNPLTNQSFQYFDPNLSYVNFIYRLATPWGGLDAGALTLRAAGNINVQASISDGFYQSGNYLDPNYVAWVGSYISSFGTTSRTIDPNSSGLYTYYLNNYSSSAVPIAPYKAAANSISPTAQDLAAADLFPNQLLVCTVNCSAPNPNIMTVTAPSSWSYGFTAGADVSSANPTARMSLASAQAGNNGVGIGSVILSNHASYTQTLINNISGNNTSIQVNLPTMIRTGTGNIAVAAALDVLMQDTTAPGVIYAAGVNTAKLADPNYSGVSSVVAANPGGFFEPRVLAYGNNATNIAGGAGLYYGPPTAAAFPEQGGDVAIDARRDIVGYSGSGNKVAQYYQPWLLSDAGVTPATNDSNGSAVSLYGAGVFTPLGTQIASQTAWWIQYGSFQQGILSAGGNVTVTAGRDLVDVSVSLPTTGRVSGGLSTTSTPVTHIYGSGNMIVRAGRNILGGSFYEGSGHASITAAGSIGQNGTVSRYASSKLLFPDYPLLAVDTGQIAMLADGSISIAGVVNPAELHAQRPSFANPLEVPGAASLPLYINTYGPDSKVRLVAVTGDLTIAVAPTAVVDNTKLNQLINAAAAAYPGSFEALALNGNLITTGISQINQTFGASIPAPGIVLSASPQGTFELLAQGSVDLTFGYPTATTLISAAPRPYISAGPSLIDTAFDPFQPNSGLDGAFSGAVLAHQNDDASRIDTVARIYAETGDITGTGSYGQRTKNDPLNSLFWQRIEINRPIKVFAGRDIIDLNLIVQNIHTSDVSSVEAGRNISYTGFNNAGGLQVAGPGFFVVQAGGDIGPFLPAAQDTASQARIQEGIASVGNASVTAVGNISIPGLGGSVGIYDTSLLGPSADPRRNTQLTTAAGTSRGADIVALFGTKFGIDYQAVIDSYIDPANAAKVVHNYIPELENFLERVGGSANPLDSVNLIDVAAVFNAFKSLPADLQHVFVDQVFVAELKAVGVSQQAGTAQFQRGYQVINTMFPSSLGYTANALGGGSNGANQPVKTGDLNLLHGTIQTRLGGDISLFGPGGNIVVGSLATEPNPNLKLRDLGILTLGQGNINTITDGSVLVNSSRVLTTQGGDVLMWSSNGDLDAGRGSQTTLSAPALQVQFDQNDYQSIDLTGFVTGAGIGTLQASRVAAKANVYLMAPRGKIDFGTAGGRSSGNLVVIAPVISNASNIQVQGTTTGIPVVSVPNVGALTSGTNTAGASTKLADAPTASGNRDQASVFLVEVIGYGGGDGQSQSPADDGQQSGTKPDKDKP